MVTLSEFGSSTLGLIRSATTNSKPNRNGHVTAYTPKLRVLAEPEPLKSYKEIFPTDYESSKAYIHGLILDNVFKNNAPDRADLIALDIWQEIDLMSKEHVIKLAQIVKAFEADKEMIRGVILKGGGMRAIPAIGSAKVINIIAELLGTAYGKYNQEPTFNSFSGASAGTIVAIALASRLPMEAWDEFCDFDFRRITNHPEILKERINQFLKTGYKIITGNDIEGDLTPTHLREIGSKLHILIAEQGNTFFPHRMFYLPDKVPGYETNLWSNSVSELALSSCYLKSLLFNECGDYHLSDPLSLEKTPIIDAGTNPKFMFPLGLVENEIYDYAQGKTEKPAFYFLIGNNRPRVLMRENNFGRVLPALTSWIVTGIDEATHFYNEQILGGPRGQAKSLGASAAYLETTCRHGSIKLASGSFGVPYKKLKALIDHNVTLTIEQLHENLVDPGYIETAGKKGQNAYQIYKTEIDRNLRAKGSVNIRTQLNESQNPATIGESIFRAKQYLIERGKRLSRVAASAIWFS